MENKQQARKHSMIRRYRRVYSVKKANMRIVQPYATTIRVILKQTRNQQSVIST